MLIQPVASAASGLTRCVVLIRNPPGVGFPRSVTLTLPRAATAQPLPLLVPQDETGLLMFISSTVDERLPALLDCLDF